LLFSKSKSITSSLSPLNRRVSRFYHWSNRDFSFCYYVQFVTSERQNSELGGFSIGYVQFITYEPRDSQVSSSSPVGIIFTVMSSISPLNGGSKFNKSQSVMSSLSPLNSSMFKFHPLVLCGSFFIVKLLNYL